MNKVAVFIPDSEAQQFLIFQKRYDVFNLLEQENVFDIQYGKAILNFAGGLLQTVEKHEIVYKRGQSYTHIP